MTRAYLCLFSCSAVLLSLGLGCGGSKKVCQKGQTECLSPSLLRTCVPGAHGEEWFLYQCQAGEKCGKPSASDGGAKVDAGTARKVDAGTDSSSTAACNGTCATGRSECASDAVVRFCVDGHSWQLQPCEGGQRCTDGACAYGDGGVQVCHPGARICGADKVEKICERDGSKWIEQPCEMGDKCLVDRCAPDPDASCDAPSRCLDNKTALHCLGEAKGFAMVKCEGDTYCEGGHCRGAVCALGSTCSAMDNQVVKCVAGKSFQNSQCAVNETCKAERDEASCVPKPCTPGEIKCGDPRDPKVDVKKYYTQCRAGTATQSGIPEWAVGECTGLLTCDPVRAKMGSPCHQDCTPRAQSCLQNLQLGLSDGWADCQDDGKIGPAHSCNQDGDLRLQCVTKPNPDSSALPEALCAEPVCAYVIANQAGVGGACDRGKLQACGNDGKLAPAADCDVGICRATMMMPQSDGRVPGACDTNMTCKDGEERCLLDSLVPTTLYQTCQSGIWSAQLSTCPSDGQCIDYMDPMGLRKKVCGADCAPGEKRCNISDQVQTCDANGKWGTAKSCSIGACSTLGSIAGKRDAACVLECMPGESRCAGVTAVASDGVSSGLSQAAVCDQTGLLGAPTNCASGSVCRVSGAGDQVGCVECVGPDVLGGNKWGYMDTRCDPTTPAKVQECAPNNSWQASRTCTSGKSCRMVNGSMCGQCLVGSTYMTCTATNLATQQICGPCSHASLGTTPLSVCRNSSIVSLTSTQTCQTLFGDGPAVAATGQAAGTTSWGTYTDCCDGKTATGTNGEFLKFADCQSRGYGTPTVAGGVPDCCSLYVTAGTGAAFAYCSP